MRVVAALCVTCLGACGRVGFDTVSDATQASCDTANPSYPQVVLADGPIGYWRLQETTGSVAADSSGNGHDGAYAGTFTAAVAGPLTGIADVGVKFDGSSGHVVVPWNLVMGDSPRTMELWMATATTGDANLLSWGAYADGSASQLGTWNNSIGFTGCCGAYNWLVPASTINWADDNWHHVAITYDQTAMLIYVDGARYAPTVDSGGTPISSGASDLWIGGAFTMNYFFDGRIAEAAIYDHPLTAARVLTHYQARAGTGCQ